MRIQNPFALYNQKSSDIKQNKTQANEGVQEMNSSSPSAKEGLKAMGFEGDSLLEKAYDVYKKNGIDPTSGMMQETKQFASQAKGSERDKLFTIEMTAQKGIEPTAKNLSAIHVALSDTENQSEAMSELMPEIKKVLEGRRVERDSNGLPIKVRSETAPGGPIQSGATETVQLSDLEVKQKAELKEAFQSLGLSEAESDKLSQLVIVKSREGYSLKTILGSLVETAGLSNASVNAFKGLVQVATAIASLSAKTASQGTGPIKIQSILEALKTMSMQEEAKLAPDLGFIGDVTTSAEGLGSLEDAFAQDSQDSQGSQRFRESNALLNAEDGWVNTDLLDLEALETGEDEGLSTLIETLEALEQNVNDTLQMTSAAYGQAELAAYFSSDNTKVFRIQEVTVKMIEVKAVFDTFQKQSLDRLGQVIGQSATGKLSGEQIGQAVSVVAEKLDTMIMKSDLTLYTDMKTERRLIGLSSELQQVQNIALKDPNQALQLLKLLHKKIETLLFQPSKDRIQAFMTQKADALLQGIKQVQAHPTTQPTTQPIGGAKMLLEVLRGLGLNHEPELLKQVLNQQVTEPGDDTRENFKAMLLKMEAEASADVKTVKAVDKMLMNLTGQQLLNKQETAKDHQTLFFNVPMGQNGQDAKLYIKARQNSNRLDWENCTAFVLVDLKQYGPTGIRLNITDRHLAMSVLTDSAELKEKMQPLMTSLTAELRDIGYLPGEVKFLSSSPKQAAEQVLKVPVAEDSQNAPEGKGVSERVSEGRKGFELKI